MIETLVIGVVTRNNATWLPFLFSQIEQIETNYNLTVVPVFVENDSTDVSAELISKFIACRSGNLLKLGRLEYTGTRFGRLGFVRNRLKALMDEYDSDWCLIIDSDVYVSASVLDDLFSISADLVGESASKRSDPIVALTPYAESCYGDPSSCTSFRVTGHYYDTFALEIDAKPRAYPYCPFSSCGECRIEGNTVPTDVPEIKLTSGFGGFLLVESGIFKQLEGWPSAPTLDECEHVEFCRSLARHGNIILIPSVKIFWNADAPTQT